MALKRWLENKYDFTFFQTLDLVFLPTGVLKRTAPKTIALNTTRLRACSDKSSERIKPSPVN